MTTNTMFGSDVTATRDASGNVVGLSAGGEAINTVNSLYLKKWRKAVASVRNSTGRAKLLMVGDSLVSGSGATGASGYGAGGRSKNMIVRLAQLLNSYFCSANSHSNIGFGAVNSYWDFDTRYTVSGWAVSTSVASLGGGLLSATNGATIAFTPTGNVDTFVVYYAKALSQGSFDINIDAEAATTIDAAAASALGAATITTATSGAHTLHITKVGTSNNYILGIYAYDSTVSAIDVVQAGHSGATAATIAASTNPYDSLNQITNFSPDLTIINLTINDWTASTAIATYNTKLQAIVTAAKISGDVILCAGVPSSTAVASVAQQKVYRDAAKQIANTNAILFVDFTNRFTSFVESNALGLYADTVHPNGLGYADLAELLFKSVTDI